MSEPQVNRQDHGKPPGNLDRILLLLLLLSVWAVMLLMEKFIPWLSAVMIMMFMMTSYAWLVSLAMIDQKRRQLKNPVPIDTSYQPRISILVPAHNEEMVIENTVATLMAIDYPDFEVLIIDDRSVDQTPAILARLKEKYPENYNYFLRPEGSFPGKSAVLNEALPMTTGEIICVFDADATIEPDFFKKIVHFLIDDEVGAVQARKIIKNSEVNWITRCQNYEYSLDSYFQAGRDTIHMAVELRGNGELIKRKALESVGGWNNYTLTDDLDLSTKLHLTGWDIRFAHKVYVWEEGITSFMPLLRQRRRWAEGSLRRYMEYSGSILTSNLAALRTKADLIAYIANFLCPIWLVSDYAVVGLDYWFGDANKQHLISSLILLPWLTIFFTSNLIVAIIRFNKPGFNKPGLIQAFTGAMMTGLYMTWIWVPIVFWVTLKILFQNGRSMNWGKTDHFGAAAQAAPVVAYAGAPGSLEAE